jgi:uncharacterized protein YebE (UPF0316 family)
MDFSIFGGEDLVAWVIIPVFIFIARILDVSIGTIRIIFVGKGYRLLAAFLGFVEVFIWIVAVSQIMKHLNNVYYYLAWASGFATGTYIGMLIEQKLSIGLVIIRIITSGDADELIFMLIKEKYHLTAVDGEGQMGKVKVIFMVINRQQLSEVIEIVNEYNPKAFYSVEDVRSVREGAIPKSNFPTFKKLQKLKRYLTTRK